MSRWSMNDCERFRRGYPGQVDPPLEKAHQNVLFYTNKIRSNPSGNFIDNIHKEWKGNYSLLEVHHGYIQWLFPIREHGLNSSAQPLTTDEIKQMKKDPEVQERLYRSFEMMLDFYGMKLVNRQTGEIKRNSNYQKCYDNLNWSSHNYLRITRILKCLGELGLEHLVRPFLEFVLKEIFESGLLKNAKRSCVDYWVEVVRNDNDRQALYGIIQNYKNTEGKKSNKKDIRDFFHFKKGHGKISKPDSDEEEESWLKNGKKKNKQAGSFAEEEEEEDVFIMKDQRSGKSYRKSKKNSQKKKDSDDESTEEDLPEKYSSKANMKKSKYDHEENENSKLGESQRKEKKEITKQEREQQNENLTQSGSNVNKEEVDETKDTMEQASNQNNEKTNQISENIDKSEEKPTQILENSLTTKKEANEDKADQNSERIVDMKDSTDQISTQNFQQPSQMEIEQQNQTLETTKENVASKNTSEEKSNQNLGLMEEQSQATQTNAMNE